MLRVTKDRKRKYVSLGISVNPENWDFSKNQPKAECPNREYIELLIADKLKEYSAKIVELKATNQEFTSTTLVEKVCVNRVTRKTVGDLFREHINSLTASGRKSYALSIKQLYNSLIEFNGHLDIPFAEMDIVWLRRYEAFLRRKGLAENTHSLGSVRLSFPRHLIIYPNLQFFRHEYRLHSFRDTAKI